MDDEERDGGMTYLEQTAAIKTTLKKLVESENVDKVIALEIMNLHYDMESLLMQCEHDRIRQLQELQNRIAIEDMKKIYDTECERTKREHDKVVRTMQDTIQTMQQHGKRK